MRVRRARGARRPERGAAAVEFALVVPFLLLFLVGIISYGYMLSFRQALSQGAAEGARAAAVWSTAYDATQDSARIAAAKSRIDEALSSYGVSCTSGGDLHGDDHALRHEPLRQRHRVLPVRQQTAHS